MIQHLRDSYNNEFTNEKYNSFLKDLNEAFDCKIDFRIAETPVFIDRKLKSRIVEAGNEIVDYLLSPQFKVDSVNAIPSSLVVPNEDEHTSLLAIDFAICNDQNGDFIPQLIELQGFASLYGYQEWLSSMYRKHFNIPENFDNKFGGLSHDEYIAKLRETIVGNHDPANVVLLEIEPWKQKTQIDFMVTASYLGIQVKCLSEIVKDGRKLYYKSNDQLIEIKRIYNRIIFDELLLRDDLPRQFNLTDDVDVEWVAHPNWFFKISKYTMPFLKSRYVPDTYFLSEIKTIPDDLENWVLKPLYSFSGQGVIFDVQKSDFDAIQNPQDYILQRKVVYAAALKSPSGPVKCEIRLLYLWIKTDVRPTLVINLGRMSKGKMIGVQYNRDLDWVGGTTYFIEQD